MKHGQIGFRYSHFLGSEFGGERAALIVTAIENCRMQHRYPYRYLSDSVTAMHDGRTDDATLTPQGMATKADAD